jgi:ubiquinone/menaquinone biosynthesis C-methylase UbiE
LAHLLFPGRHLVNTRFQEEYLLAWLGQPLGALPVIGSAPQGGTLDELVFAVTSANQANSRYNPIPFHVRALGVDRFARHLKDALDVDYRIVGIPHFGPTPRFAELTVKEIREQTEDDLHLDPENTVVLCSTPTLIEAYMALGYAVLPAEWDTATNSFLATTPIEVIKRLAELGEGWNDDPALRRALAPAWYGLFRDFPEVPRRVTRLYRDPLLNDHGSLTDTRNYGTYARAMDSIIGLKYQEIKVGVAPGKIVDEGCADGALLVQLAKDFPDSDLIGIDIAAEFIARCHERQRMGEFGGAFVHVHQRNLLEPIFEPNSIDTTICNSTTHELWSYGDRQATLDAYLGEKFRQTRKGGRLVIRDVVGFPAKQDPVLMVCEDADGKNEGIFDEFADNEALARHLEGLSTRARFLRFARDFLAEQRANGVRGPETQIQFEELEVAGRPGFWLRWKDAMEFLTKKDYVDNWRSEVQEEFCFWSFDEWKQALARAGFTVLENPNHPEEGSRAYVSAWRVQHSFRNKVMFYAERPGEPELLDYPVTNMILVGEKR